MKFSFWYFLNFLFISSFLWFTIYLITNPSTLSGVTLSEYDNNFCQNAFQTYPDRTNPVHLICNNKYKKDKFIWIFLEGLAYDQLTLIQDKKFRSVYNITNIARVKSKDYQQSGSWHETVITGRFSRNFPAQETKIDHILKQVKHSGEETLFRGSPYPLYYLLGQAESKDVFYGNIFPSEEYVFSTLCPGAFPGVEAKVLNEIKRNYTSPDENNRITNTTKRKEMAEQMMNMSAGRDEVSSRVENFNTCISRLFNWTANNEDAISNPTARNPQSKLENWLKHPKDFPIKTKGFNWNATENMSLVFYSTRMDYLNHSYDKRSWSAIIESFYIELALTTLIEWINNYHPEYALFISSDHGGQEYNGQDNICNHGCDDDGNEGVFTVYTRELGMNYNKLKIGTPMINPKDMAPTVAQFLKNVNLPLEAEGFPQWMAQDDWFWYTNAKSKEIQLIQYIDKLIKKYPNQRSSLSPFWTDLKNSEYSTKIKTGDDIYKQSQMFYTQYITFLERTQERLMKTIGGSDNYSFIVFIWFVIAGLLFKLYLELKKVREIFSSVMKDNVIFVIITIIIFYEVVVYYFMEASKDTFTIIRVSEFLFLGFICFWYQVKVSPNGYYSFIFGLVFMIVSIVNFVIYFSQFLVTTTRFFDSKAKIFLCHLLVNYPWAGGYWYLELRHYKNMYFDSTLKRKYLSYNIPFVCFILFQIVIYDLFEPWHFYFHTWRSFNANRLLFLSIAIYNVCCFKKLYKKSKFNPESKDPITIQPVKSWINAKISVFWFVFFISDEVERGVIILCFCSVNYLLSNQLRKNTEISWKYICIIAMLLWPDILYVTTQNSFSIDIPLEVTAKCVGEYAKSTPVLTGILSNMHKFKLFLWQGAYYLSIIKVSRRKFLKNEGLMIRIVVDIQMLLLLVLYLIILSLAKEERYLQLFIWFMSKCFTTILLDCALITWRFIYYFGTTKRDDAEEEKEGEDNGFDNNNNENDRFETNRNHHLPAAQVIEMVDDKKDS